MLSRNRRPSRLSEILVTQSSSPGQLVVDPFMGSGSTGVAAARNGRDFAGNDLCREAIEIARERLIAEKAHEGVLPRRTAIEQEPQLGLSM